MSFQWLQLRIGEEKERRDREAQVLARLPRAIDEIEQNLAECIQDFGGELGGDTARVTRDGLNLQAYGDGGTVEVAAVLELPGIEIRRGGAARQVKVGVLPGDKVFYLDVEADQYLTMAELTRLVLDRVLFPKLKED